MAEKQSGPRTDAKLFHPGIYGFRLRRARDGLRDHRFAHAFTVYRRFDLRLDEPDRGDPRRVEPRLLARRKKGRPKARYPDTGLGDLFCRRPGGVHDPAEGYYPFLCCRYSGRSRDQIRFLPRCCFSPPPAYFWVLLRHMRSSSKMRSSTIRARRSGDFTLFQRSGALSAHLRPGFF